MEGIINNRTPSSFNGRVGKVSAQVEKIGKGKGAHFGLFNNQTRVLPKYAVVTSIRPLVRFCGLQDMFSFRSDAGQPHYIKVRDPIRQSLLCDPESEGLAENLEVFCDINICYKESTCCFQGPSFQEIVANIPAEYLQFVTAFEILAKSDSVEGSNRRGFVRKLGYCYRAVRLYI